MKICGVSVAVLAVQLALVSTIGTKYAWERARCPRVWVRASQFDPSLLMRGRYLSMQLEVDGCRSTLDSEKDAQFVRDQGGVPQGGRFAAAVGTSFPATLKAENGKLMAVRVARTEETPHSLTVWARPGAPCDRMTLWQPVDFYLPEHAQNPMVAGAELWVEVTVPPAGPPRPIQLARKEAGGSWVPLASR